MVQQTPTALLGGIPTVGLDVPVLSVLLVIFIGLAAANMTLLQRNNKRGHKFIISGLLFGFCMSRIGACVLRIVWSTRQSDFNVTIAASVFLNAGVLLIYIVNNILAQRILRSALPKVGWHPLVRYGHRALLFLLLPLLIMQIVAIIQLLLSSDPHTKAIDHDIQLGPVTYMVVIAALPYVLIAVAVIVPWIRGESAETKRDEFGQGAWKIKVITLLITTGIGLTEAGFRCGTTWMPSRPITDPAWYQSKAAFYCFNFMLDIFVIAAFLIARIDLRFHVRNKANGPGHYSAPIVEDEASENETVPESGEKEIVTKV